MPQSYTEGQRLLGSDGQIYIVQGGVPRPEGGSTDVSRIVAPSPVRVAKEAQEQAAKRQEAVQRDLAIEKARRDLANTPDPSAPAIVSPTSNVNGDAFLKTLPATEATTVRGLAQGRLQFPTGAALRQPYWQKMLSNVVNFDPTFEQGDYGARYKLRNEFTSGKSAANIRALNTALSHARELQQAGKALDNYGGWETLLNGPRAAILSAKGDPRIAAFNTARQAFADELESVFANGGGSVSGRQDWRDMFSTASSPEQFQAAMAEAGKLLGGRVMALQDQYSRGMGPAAGIGEFFNKDAREVYPELTGAPLPGTAPEGQNGGGGVPGASGGTGPSGGSGGPLITGDGGHAVVGTGMNAVPNPAGQAILDQEQSLLTNNASDDRIRAWAANVYGNVPAHIEELLKARAGGAKIALNPGEGLLTKNVPADQGLIGKIADAAATSPAAVFAGEAGNSVAAGIPQALARAVSPNADMTDLRFNTARNANPTASGLGQLTGGALGAAAGEGLAAKGIAKLPFVFRGLQGADRAAAIAPWAARLGDTAYGATAGATGNPDNPGYGALLGGALGYGGGVTGRAVARGAGNAFTGVKNEAVRTLADRGIPMTAGQILGNSGRVGSMIKGLEDRLTGIPVVGDMVNARRREGFNGFNRAAFDEGGASIGAPSNGVIRAPGVEALDSATSDAYTRALDGVNVTADAPFGADYGGAMRAGNALPEPMRDNARYTLDTSVGNSFAPNGDLSGTNFQQAVRGLRKDASSLSDAAYGHQFGDVTGQAEDALTGLLNRQAPGVMPQYDAANQAFRLKEVLRDAVNKARNGSRSGETEVFTPSQLSDAAAANARKYGNTQGTTRQPFYDLNRAGQEVLPSKVPDSGTAGRLATLALPGILGGGGGAVDYATGTSGAGAAGLTLGALLAAGGSRRAQQLLQTILLDRPDAMIRIGNQINGRQALGGMLGAPLMLEAQR